MFLASSGPLGGPLEGLLGRLGVLLGRLEAILGRLGALLDGLGPSWSALGPSWSSLGPSWGAPGPSWSRLGPLLDRLERPRRPKKRPRGLQEAPGGPLDFSVRASPLPWTPPLRASPHQTTSITRTSLFPLPAWHGDGKRMYSQSAIYRWLARSFSLSPRVEVLLQHLGSILGAL